MSQFYYIDQNTPHYQSRRLPSLKTKIVPRKQKAALASCVSLAWPGPGPATLATLVSLSGPALQSPVSRVSGAGAGLITEFLRCVSVSEVSPALWSSVTLRLQWREHIRTSVQPPDNTRLNSALVTLPLLSSPTNVSVVQFTLEGNI